MNSSINSHVDSCKTITAMVWFSSAVALKEGAAVCYNWDYGTATNVEGKRFNTVETPTTSNAQYFAGVAAAAYIAKSGGQFIEIHKPGSLCKILVGEDTVIGVDILTFDVTAAKVGQFIYAGLPGEGSAVPMQTTTFDTTAHLCLAKLQVGAPSGGVELITAVNGAIVAMVGGTTLILGASIGGNCIETLDDGTVPGLRKKFNVVTTEITTNDFVLTITNGVTDDIDDVALASVTWAGAGNTVGKEVTLEWNGGWMLTGRSKTLPVVG